jgi:hypothetical protein
MSDPPSQHGPDSSDNGSLPYYDKILKGVPEVLYVMPSKSSNVSNPPSYLDDEWYASGVSRVDFKELAKSNYDFDEEEPTRSNYQIEGDGPSRSNYRYQINEREPQPSNRRISEDGAQSTSSDRLRLLEDDSTSQCTGGKGIDATVKGILEQAIEEVLVSAEFKVFLEKSTEHRTSNVAASELLGRAVQVVDDRLPERANRLEVETYCQSELREKLAVIFEGHDGALVGYIERKWLEIMMKLVQ